jgi:putative oxidoreductase
MAHAHTLDTAPRGSDRGKVWNVALWVLQVAAAGMFFMAGFSKLTGAEPMVGLFEAVGIGQWFRYLTGGLEVIGAVLLLLPTLAGLGALVLAAVMLGAIATHLFVVGGSPLMPLVLLAVLGVIAFARRDRTARLLAR